MSVSTVNEAFSSQTPVVRGAEYALYGQARTGGTYNSHLVAGALIIAFAGFGVLNVWLAVWATACLFAAMLLDETAWDRKVALAAIPSQFGLYLQVLVQAAWDALPYFVFAYVLYVCVAPIILPTNFVVSSFVMLYAFYMIIRGYWLARYLWLLNFHWDQAGRTFEVHRANFKSQSMAIRHVLWSYFLGNIGLIIRCSSQVLTVGLFEYLRTTSGMTLETHSIWSQHLMVIFIVAAVIYTAMFWLAVRRALLIYYRTHRTFHSSRPLYDCIHAIHHRGVLPTPLDSGTISPAEFFITEMVTPAAALVPNWWWTMGQVILAWAGHIPSHDAGTRRSFSQHHLYHHKLFCVNFGLTPSEDKRFGTLFDRE